MFRTPAGLSLNNSQVAEKIIAFMRANSDAFYRIAIGTDSEGTQKEVDFATAIVVYRVGNGGCYFWRRKKIPQIYNLHDRLIQEVVLSLNTAKEILTTLKTYETPSFNFEIHIDMGEKGESHAMLSETLGMVRAHNFETKTKPESYAASCVADRYV